MSHASCSHAKYRLTCEQYEELRSLARGRCQICGQLERYSPARKLQIDHDKALGYWAVRGLLCGTCNLGLSRKVGMTGPEVDTYLTNPWHSKLGYVVDLENEEDEGPALDPSVAVDLLRKAADDAADAKRRNIKEWRDVRSQLHDLMRAADRGGMRQVDIAAAAKTSREVVYTATRERRNQPKLPPRQREAAGPPP